MSATTDKRATQAESSAAASDHTATLASAIACDAATLVEVLTDLIGGCGKPVGVLALMRIAVARMGAAADAIAIGHGGAAWAGDVHEWIYSEIDAGRALRDLVSSGATRPIQQRKPR